MTEPTAASPVINIASEEYKTGGDLEPIKSNMDLPSPALSEITRV